MDYKILAILAMIFYGLYQFGIKEVSSNLPAVSVLLVANISIFVGPALYVFYTDGPVVSSFLSVGPWLLGLLAGIGFVFLYSAIDQGPLSIVAPIHGMYMLVPSILGVIVLHEDMTITRGLGIIFAIVAVILLTR